MSESNLYYIKRSEVVIKNQFKKNLDFIQYLNFILVYRINKMKRYNAFLYYSSSFIEDKLN